MSKFIRQDGFKFEHLVYFKEFHKELTGYALMGLEHIINNEIWVPSKEGTILSEKEIITLSWIATTKGEALQILERNSGLLEDLYNSGCGEVREIGCPHCYRDRSEGRECPGPFVCAPCAWIVLEDSNIKHQSVFCREQSFGGYKLEDSFIQYSDNCESLEDLASDNEELLDERNNRNSVFLGGHVEWALMLKTGDMATVNKPFRSWSEDERFEWQGRAQEQIAKGKRRE